MLKSQLCRLLEIEYPILQGGMAWIADGRLAASVSNAGGFGIIAAGNLKAEEVKEEIHKAKELTDKPFGLNIMLMSRYADDISELAIKEKIAAVTTGAGNPAKYMTDWKGAGIRVMPVVASTAMAKLMLKAGADALIAEGGESGGHVGELTTMVLVPLIADVAAGKVPVIAAGGIADGRGMAAAFMLGACGVQIGTRFLSADECTIHPNYRERILKAGDLATAVTGRRINHAARSLRTPYVREYLKAEYGGVSDEELSRLTTGAFRLAVKEGNPEKGCFLAGQAAALVNKTQSAAEIVKEICEETEKLLENAGGFLNS